LYLNGQRTDDAGLNGLAEGLATLGQTPSVEMQSGGIPPLDVSAEMSRVYQLLRGEKAPAEGAPAGAAAVAAPAAEPLMRIETNHAVKRVVCSPDGKKLALITPAANVDQIGLYDADTVKRTAVFDLVDKEEEAGVARAYQAVGSYHVQVTAIEFSPDSSLLAIGSNLGKVRCFDSHSGALQLTLDDPQLHPDEENSDASGNRPDGVRRAYRGSVMSLAFSPDGGTLATSCVVPPSVYGGIGGKPTPPVEAGVKLWNPRTGQLKRLLPYAHAVSFSPDGKQLAAVTTWQAGDCESEWGIKLWNAETGALERLLAIPRKSFGKGTPEFPALAYSSDGARLVLGVSTVAYQAGPAGTTTSSITSDFVDLFDPTKATPVATLDVTGRGPAAFSPDGKVLACLGRPGASSSDSPEARRDFNLVTLIDATNGRLVGEIRSPLPAATNWNCFTFIPGSGRIAIGGLNGVFGVTVWAVPKVTLPPSLIHLER
jgi:WD40 repeat protein